MSIGAGLYLMIEDIRTRRANNNLKFRVKHTKGEGHIPQVRTKTEYIAKDSLFSDKKEEWMCIRELEMTTHEGYINKTGKFELCHDETPLSIHRYALEVIERYKVYRHNQDNPVYTEVK
ncbi:MAG: hypothetical protein KUG81_02790 [Gammaproteobacteria bacterium]|nr:hypothetical protein [Gammaproteobacteria bacterium]